MSNPQICLRNRPDLIRPKTKQATGVDFPSMMLVIYISLIRCPSSQATRDLLTFFNGGMIGNFLGRECLSPAILRPKWLKKDHTQSKDIGLKWGRVEGRRGGFLFFFFGFFCAGDFWGILGNPIYCIGSKTEFGSEKIITPGTSNESI